MISVLNLDAGQPREVVPVEPVGLRYQFEPDFIQTFANPVEFAEEREFRIMESGAEITFATEPVWDEPEMRTRAIVQQQGVYLGTTMCFIKKSLFAVAPRPEQIIYSRLVGESTWIGYRVAEIADAGAVYEMALDKMDA